LALWDCCAMVKKKKNKKMTLKVENWLWFPSYERALVRTSYRAVDE